MLKNSSVRPPSNNETHAAHTIISRISTNKLANCNDTEGADVYRQCELALRSAI